MSRRSCNSFGSHFLWIRGKKKYDTSNNKPCDLNHPQFIKSEDAMKELNGSISSLNDADGEEASAVNISLGPIYASKQLNGNAPTRPIGLEVDHDLHNTSTLLASEKRNKIGEKTNLLDFNLNLAKSNSGDDLPNISVDNVQHCSRKVSPSLSPDSLDSIEAFDDHNDDVDATKLSFLNLPKTMYLKLPQLAVHGDGSIVENALEDNLESVVENFLEDTNEVGNIDNDKGIEHHKCDECIVDCLYCALVCCECTIL